MQDNSNYSNYSLDELYDKYKNLEKNKRFEQAKILLEEINKRKGIKKYTSQGKELANIVSWKRRGFAFLIDYGIYIALWGVIDNILYFPVPQILLILLSALIFFYYFYITEVNKKNPASYGKRITKIKVLTWDGEIPSRRQIIIRSSIVTAIVLISWDSLINSLIFISIPIIIFVIIASIENGILIYNGWLAIKGHDNLMIQDCFTSTKVFPFDFNIKKEDIEVSGCSPEKIRFPSKPIICLIFMFVALIYLLFMATVNNQNVLSLLENKNPNKLMEEALADECGIRSVIDVESSIITDFDTDSSVTTLNIFVWIPFAVWNNDSLQKYIDVALSKFDEEPGYYDNGQIELSTGFEYLNISRSFDLNLSSEINATYWFNKGIKTELNEQKIEYFTNAISIDSQHINAINNRGLAYFNSGKYQESIEDFDRAIQINPNFAYAYFYRGLVFRKLGYIGYYEKAAENFNKYLELHGNKNGNAEQVRQLIISLGYTPKF